MSKAYLQSIYRYPVKGFAGRRLSGASLLPGEGLPFDRFMGVTNGSAAISTTGWSPCQGFVRMTKNEGLPLFGIDFQDDTQSLVVTSPHGRTIAVDLASALSVEHANTEIASWFPATGAHPPQLSRRHRDLGWWDYDDAAISIINVETIADLSRKAGREVDPLRFRANFYVAGLAAWSEWKLIGRRVRIGDAELEVIRPIDRCKATSVNPTTGEVDINMPALLALQEGHIFCGMYARVVKSGRVRAGDAILDLGSAVDAIVTGAANPNPPAPHDWPRYAEVVKRVDESASTVSLWMKDPIAAVRAHPKPGQHIRVHFAAEGREPAWRSYTISGVENDLLRISVKNEGRPQGVSSYIHDTATVGGHVLISGPFGRFHLAEDASPLVLVSAGIGITPMTAILRALAESGDVERKVDVLHSARGPDDLALWDELRRLADGLPNVRCRLYLSRAESPAPPDAHAGRIGAEAFDGMALEDTEIFICGPQPFMNDIQVFAQGAGARVAAIHSERFASPAGTKLERRPAPFPGPLTVRFEGAEAEASWSIEKGTLLELAEDAGLALPANCRAGVCGACRQTVRQGTVFHLTEPPFPLAPQEVLTCCAVPTSDLVIGG
ncbi:MOSC domain-containing protein [Bradyrhizobium tropiciagri]|uniref:MOSC domain-containing protein n=1 Tax=Bradyrhizobium tropiciagri TaxID=312253 RepID=UPI001BAAEC45|nr:MOSC domain-containing protein [Bradyrhizobium tropiciagri]MBR0898919.1 MOSC domain-containing protein [Bradyrhizobium tropiciagri]